MRARPKSLAFVLVVTGVLALGRPAAADPFVPADDGEVMERLPVSPLDPGPRQLQALRRELAQQPDDLRLAARVAWLSIEQGRALSDPRYYGYAQGALAPWWAAAEPPVSVLVLRATIRQHNHDFAGALNDLSLALRADPSHAQAWLTQAVVLQVRGEYAAAKHSCQQVLQLANPLIALTCLSSVDSLNGAAAKSYDRLRRALAQHGADRGARAWALTTLAEIAVRSGRPQAAEAHFRQALSLGQSDDYLLGAYADFLLDQNRPGAVLALLKDRTRADALLLRLALAEHRVSREGEACPEHVQALRDRFAAARRRGDTVHQREEARFTLELLQQPRLALDLAKENWAVQREPWDARILLESALASGEREAARPVLAFLADTGLEDATLARLAAEARGARS